MMKSFLVQSSSLLFIISLVSAIPLDQPDGRLDKRESGCQVLDDCPGGQGSTTQPPPSGTTTQPPPSGTDTTQPIAPTAPSQGTTATGQPPAGTTADPTAPSVFSPPDPGDVSASLAAYTNAPTFQAYVPPTEQVTEWIALGDSYTSGVGSNGAPEELAGSAARGAHGYPNQMATNTDRWARINGGGAGQPRFSWSAYTGDKTTELEQQQLVAGAYAQSNINQPRPPFGKPQLAVMTIGGNDVGLSTILNDCIYHGWWPGDCQKTLATANDFIDQDKFKLTVMDAMLRTYAFGVIQGGATPANSFQLYVAGYIPFFNEDTTDCDSISWRLWWRPWDTKPLLTRDLRRQLNDLAVKVNIAIEDAANSLRQGGLGVFYVDGLVDQFDAHLFCEPGHSSEQMIDADTWFWSNWADTSTTSEGPGDTTSPYPTSNGNTSVEASAETMADQIIQFVFGSEANNVQLFSQSDPPWTVPNKYPDLDSILDAMEMNATANSGGSILPLHLRRSFNPKGTAYGDIAALFFNAIAANRGGATAAQLDATNATSGVVNITSGPLNRTSGELGPAGPLRGPVPFRSGNATAGTVQTSRRGLLDVKDASVV